MIGTSLPIRHSHQGPMTPLIPESLAKCITIVPVMNYTIAFYLS